jgi:hypothetical protein
VEVLAALERHGPVRYWIVDDTSFPKQGQHSVGVARQYCGQLGKPDNGQVAVSLSVANDHASLPIAYRLFLPEAWANDPLRRAKAGVPAAIGFASKTAIAPSAALHPRADRNTCVTRRISATRRRCGLSGMCRARSRPFAVRSPSGSLSRCPDVPAVCGNRGSQ